MNEYTDITGRKQTILVELTRLQQDCELLLERIPVLKEKLLLVNTLEDAKEFDEESGTLGDGLQILSL